MAKAKLMTKDELINGARKTIAQYSGFMARLCECMDLRPEGPTSEARFNAAREWLDGEIAKKRPEENPF